MIELRTLDRWAPFGFETTARWQVAIDQGTKQGKCGYEARLYGESAMTTNNAAKILAYIPLINVIVGIARIIFFAKDYKADSNDAQHIWRGIADALFGPLMLIIDIIQTVRDNNIVKEYIAKYPEAALIQHPERLSIREQSALRKQLEG